MSIDNSPRALRRPRFLDVDTENEISVSPLFSYEESQGELSFSKKSYKNKEKLEQNDEDADINPDKMPATYQEDTGNSDIEQNYQIDQKSIQKSEAKHDEIKKYDDDTIKKHKTGSERKISDVLIQEYLAEEKRKMQSGDRNITSAISRLNEIGAFMAAQARADALEIGCMIARKIIQDRLVIDIEPLFNIIKNALRKAGKARVVSVILSPYDLDKISKYMDETGEIDLNLLNVELIEDFSLGTGDVVVETNFGYVDGRIDRQIEKIRTAISEAFEESR